MSKVNLNTPVTVNYSDTLTESEQLLIVTNMTKDEFKQFSKSLMILMESGLNQFEGIRILCMAIRERQKNRF